MARPPAPRRRWYGVIALLLAVAAGAAGWLAARTTEPAEPAESVPDEASVDVGFLRDMADHHDQAVQLALIQLANGRDEVLKGFAVDTIASQRYEIGLMDARLQDWGVGRGAIDRQAMTWMGMPTPVSSMPGMASAEQLADVARARGADADRLFIQLLIAHHEGGIHMAEDAMRRAGNGRVRALAERIAKVQRLEVRDLLLAQARLEAVDNAAP